jgi:hypothetical protein
MPSFRKLDTVRTPLSLYVNMEMNIECEFLSVGAIVCRCLSNTEPHGSLMESKMKLFFLHSIHWRGVIDDCLLQKQPSHFLSRRLSWLTCWCLEPGECGLSSQTTMLWGKAREHKYVKWSVLIYLQHFLNTLLREEVSVEMQQDIQNIFFTMLHKVIFSCLKQNSQ